MLSVRQQAPDLHRALHSILLLHSHPLLHSPPRFRHHRIGLLSVLAPWSIPEMLLNALQHPVRNPSGHEHRTVVRVVVLPVEILQHLRRQSLVVLPFGESSQRMLRPEQFPVQSFPCHHLHSLCVHQIHLLVGFRHNPQFPFRKHRLLHHLRQHPDSLLKEFSQRVKSDESAVHRRRQVQPCPVEVQFLGYFSRSHLPCALPEHSVRHHSLKRETLVQLSAANHQIQSYHVLHSGIYDVESHAVRHDFLYRSFYIEIGYTVDSRHSSSVHFRNL